MLTEMCPRQVPEQRVFTSVLPTHMAAPSAGVAIVAFADTGFFRLLVVGMHNSNVITRCNVNRACREQKPSCARQVARRSSWVTYLFLDLVP